MDDELLKTFLEIHKTRHFGKAAENLFITQSAVSARIRQLEEEIGVQLFFRERNNIRPTPAGEKLVRHAENILNNWNKVKIEIAIEDENKVPVSVAAVSSLWDIHMNKWLLGIRDKIENIVLNCSVLSSDLISQKICNNSLDLGFTYNPPGDDVIKIIKKIPIKFIMVSSIADQSADEAIRSGYVYVDWGTSFSAAHSEHFRDIPSPQLRTDLGRIARNYITRKGGSAYLPESMVKRDIQNEKLYPVTDAPVIKRSAYAIQNKGNDKDTIIRSLMTG